LECIAGDSSTYETTHNEDKIKFRVDISKVYWCSKLDTERQRMVSLMKEGEVLCDMFCGIGPLALRAAVKRKVKVLANDLNPECFKYLKQNIDLNKVKNLIVPFNMDAREFARLVIKKGTEAS
jgi:tRNA (guanine37-N1)-methyltransferase